MVDAPTTWTTRHCFCGNSRICPDLIYNTTSFPKILLEVSLDAYHPASFPVATAWAACQPIRRGPCTTVRIANDDVDCGANIIQLVVAADAKSYEISVPAKNHTETFPTK